MTGLRERLDHFGRLVGAYMRAETERDELVTSEDARRYGAAIVTDYDPPWAATRDGVPKRPGCYWVMTPVSSAPVFIRWDGPELGDLVRATHWKPARVPAPPVGTARGAIDALVSAVADQIESEEAPPTCPGCEVCDGRHTTGAES